MLKLNFQINPAYLAYHFIKNTSPSRFVSGECDPEIVDFQNAAWGKDRAANDFIRFGPDEDTFLSGKSMVEMARRADDLLKQMLNHSSFVPLLAETSKSLVQVREEWESNYSKTNNMIGEMTGLNLNKDVSVYLTHPKLKQGHAGHDCIVWAYRLTWPNYNTVYLWHELLHLLLPHGNLEHAVIQLISDNEMRVRLNGGTYPPMEGHEYLRKLMELLLPMWRLFLQSKETRDINSFISKAASLPEIKKELLSCDEHRYDE